jgi:hypothetical protein
MTIVSALKTADILDLVSACENIQGFLRHGGKDGVRSTESVKKLFILPIKDSILTRLRVFHFMGA